MGKKKLQGADGINFQMQLTIKGLETVTFPKETLTNESGKDIAWIECLGGKVSAYVNLPHAVRPNNIQPFQLSDCIQIDLISDKVIEYMKAYAILLVMSVLRLLNKQAQSSKNQTQSSPKGGQSRL